MGKAAPTANLYDTMAKVVQLKKIADGIKSSVVEPKRFTSDVIGERVGFVCQSEVQQSGVSEQSLLVLVQEVLSHVHQHDSWRTPKQVILSIPEDQAITAIDAEGHELIGPIAAGCGGGDLIALTLWLIAERAKGAESAYASLISTIPVRPGLQNTT